MPTYGIDGNEPFSEKARRSPGEGRGSNGCGGGLKVGKHEARWDIRDWSINSPTDSKLLTC